MKLTLYSSFFPYH